MNSNALIERWGLPTVRGHWPLVWAMVIDTLGTGLFLPFTILYFLTTTRMHVAEIGFGLAVSGGASLPFGPVCGTLADRWGARTVVVGSNVLRVVGFIGFLGVRTFPELLITSLIVQIGNRAFYASYTPLVTQVAPIGQRERWFGLVSSVRNVGFALGGLIAGVAITSHGKTAYYALVIVNAASFALAAVLLMRLKLRPLPAAQTSSPSQSGWRAVLSDRPYLILTAVNIAFAMASNALDVVLPVYLVRILALPAWTAGASFGLNCVLVSFAQGPVVPKLEGRNRGRLLVLAGVISAVSVLVFLAADGLPLIAALVLVAIGVILFSLSELIASPVMSAMSAEAAPDALRGRYIALFQMSWTVANSVGVAVMGWLLSVGAAATWGFLAVVSLAGSLGIGIVGKHLDRPPVEPPEPTEPTESVADADAESLPNPAGQES